MTTIHHKIEQFENPSIKPTSLKLRSTKLRSTILALSIAAISNSPSTALAIDKEAGGFGLGALVGGILAGPPGAVIGAIGGTWAGHNDTQQELTIAVISAELVEKENQITKLQTEHSVTEAELSNTIQRINTDKRLVTLEYLEKGLTTTVYFRTGEADLPDPNSEKLFQLAQLLKEFPELQISMEGHTDVRGDNPYNQQLSEHRIETIQEILVNAGIPEERIHCEAYGETEAMTHEGDNENYVFDRRVSIHVSLATTS